MAPIRHFVTLLSIVVGCTLGVYGSKITISEDGGYTDVVIKISKDLTESDCPAILKGIKVRFSLFNIHFSLSKVICCFSNFACLCEKINYCHNKITNALVRAWKCNFR